MVAGGRYGGGMNRAPARWRTRAWLSLLLLLPFVAGCDASGGSGTVHWTAQARVVTPGAPEAATSTLPVVLRVQNQAVPPGPRRPPVPARRAKAGKPNPKLREAVVRATRAARAEALAAKDPAGRPAQRPVADARPWGPKGPPTASPAAAPATPPAASPAPPPATPRPTVAAAEPAPAPEGSRGHGHAAGWHDDAGVATAEAPGPLDGLDWNVPAALLVGALAATLLGARRP